MFDFYLMLITILVTIGILSIYLIIKIKRRHNSPAGKADDDSYEDKDLMATLVNGADTNKTPDPK